MQRHEEIAVIFPAEDRHPVLLALRESFPLTAHTNPLSSDFPVSPCIDDRPWADAVLSWTPYAYIERVKWWFTAAAAGELAGIGQVLDPLFFSPGPDLLISRRTLESLSSEISYVLLPAGPAVSARFDNAALRLLEATEASRGSSYPFRLCFAALPPSDARALEAAPANLGELIALASRNGLDLLGILKNWVLSCDPVARLSKLVVLLACPVRQAGSDGGRRDDVRAFLIDAAIGAVGAVFGLFEPLPDGGAGWGRIISGTVAAPVGDLTGLRLISVDVALDYDQELSRASAGIEAADALPTLLLGAGAIGSHLALICSKHGTHSFSAIVDDDWLRPHNIVRHVLGPEHIGCSKAVALANALSTYLLSAPEPIVANLFGSQHARDGITAAADRSKLILDATASVAVGRELACWDTKAACASAFFNPRGDAAVLLIEDPARTIRIDALEAQYYRLLMRNASLHNHLSPGVPGLRHSAACRALSARIPEASVAALSAPVADALGEAPQISVARVIIWSRDRDGSVARVDAHGAATERRALGCWTVVMDDDLATALRARRNAALPAETGGMLVGIVDTSRQMILLVDALSPPPDSNSRPTEFVRGVLGTERDLDAVAQITSGMVRYVGEWHTHPAGHSSDPSMIDFEQLVTLRQELSREGLPATMLIVGETDIGIVQLQEASGR